MVHALKYFLSGYFHQDWDHTHQTWEAVVDAFLNDSPARVSQVPLDINCLLVETPDDARLEEELDGLGMAISRARATARGSAPYETES